MGRFFRPIEIFVFNLLIDTAADTIGSDIRDILYRNVKRLRAQVPKQEKGPEQEEHDLSYETRPLARLHPIARLVDTLAKTCSNQPSPMMTPPEYDIPSVAW